METAQPSLPIALRPYVAACFGYHEENVPEYVHVGLPSATLTIVIDLADGLLVSGLGHHSPQRFAISVAGLHSSPAAIHEHGTSHGVMLYLTPLGARALLGLPAGGTGASGHRVGQPAWPGCPAIAHPDARCWRLGLPHGAA